MRVSLAVQKGATSVGFREYIEILPGAPAETLPERRGVAVRYEVSLLGYVKETEEVRGRVYDAER